MIGESESFIFQTCASTESLPVEFSFSFVLSNIIFEDLYLNKIYTYLIVLDILCNLSSSGDVHFTKRIMVITDAASLGIHFC